MRPQVELKNLDSLRRDLRKRQQLASLSRLAASPCRRAPCLREALIQAFLAERVQNDLVERVQSDWMSL
jgi:hypothetical protein